MCARTKKRIVNLKSGTISKLYTHWERICNYLIKQELFLANKTEKIKV